MIPDPQLVVRDLAPLLFAALVGCGIGLGYLLVERGRERMGAIRIANACVVLTLVICLIARVVEDLATAFIVVGALTLVRLRAAIGDTREFGFLLLAVAAGLGAGERRYGIVLLGALLVCGLAILLAPSAGAGVAHRVSLTLPDAAVDEVRAAIAAASPRHALRLREAGDGRTGVRADFTGAPALADALLARLRTLPGAAGLRYDAVPARRGA